MSRSRSEDERGLSADELDLVSRSRQPTVKSLTDSELAKLAGLLRERCDGAREKAKRRRRDHRVTADAAGAGPAPDNASSDAKSYLLAAAVKRTNKEKTRRRSGRAKTALVDHAERALALKKAAAERAPDRPVSRSAGEGMRPIESAGLLPVERQGERPVLERSRKVR